MQLYKKYLYLKESTKSALKLLDLEVKERKEGYEKMLHFKKSIEAVDKYFNKKNIKADITIANVKDDLFNISIVLKDFDKNDIDEYEKDVSELLDNSHPLATDYDITNGLLRFQKKI